MGYTLITGGELRNKGAQAMSFISCNEMNKRFPEDKVILFSHRDASRDREEKDNYLFEILPFPSLRETMILGTKILVPFHRKHGASKYFERYVDIFSKANRMIDISGYALGTNWSTSTIKGYMRRILLAKLTGVNVYIMPQSFGPFEFDGFKGKLLKKYIGSLLKYPQIIMAREKQGKDALECCFGLKNVKLCPDLVLCTPECDYDYVYKKQPESFNLPIKKNSIAIIPNSKNNKYGDKNAIENEYYFLIEELVKKEKNVYLIYHAIEDFEICQRIKDRFSSENRVYLIEEELSCAGFEKIVEKFDFVIASRYHSVVHAYKAATPVLIIGWSVKYIELAKLLHQEEFCFDVQNVVEIKDIMTKIDRLLEFHQEESKNIKKQLLILQKNNSFDMIK